MPSKPINSKDLRNALGSFATGVTIVTSTGENGEDVGVTVNSFNSVSLDPPLILWSLAKNARSLTIFEKAKNFAVHVLSDEQIALSNRFATQQEDKFTGLEIGRGLGNVPLLQGCVSCFQCETRNLIDGGDHIIFIGEVQDFSMSERDGLLYHRGQYSVSEVHPLIQTQEDKNNRHQFKLVNGCKTAAA